MPILYFDLDDTLYDRSVPLIEALERHYGTGGNDFGRAAAECTRCSAALLALAKQGRITREEEIVGRYRIGLRVVGLSVTDAEALHIHTLYEEAQKRICLSETMKECLNICKARFDAIGILTNGTARKQRGKIESLGLAAWVDPKLIVISEEVGILKPDRRIFTFAEERAQAHGSSVTMVGDTYANDLRTAIELGWQTVWLKTKERERPQGSPAALYEADDEMALLETLKTLNQQKNVRGRQNCHE